VTHRELAAQCFNDAWDLIEKPTRTPEETDQMIDLAHASRWHWTQARDCTPLNLTVAAWQLSRVYALAGVFNEATRYAQASLQLSQAHNVPPFYEAYAYEALARAAEGDDRDRYLAAARDLIPQVEKERDRTALLADLDDIQQTTGS
jgi:hypothetical protein